MIALLRMKTFLTGCLALAGTLSFAQSKQDTTRKLNEVIIRPYFSLQPLLRATATIGLVDTAVLDKQNSASFVAAVNTVPGVRMEERSPGSYRLSIRGSSLRAPFGVRNVKIYLDDFPLTDAGGNTYLNALDVAGTAQIQILKGPQGSIFGANSGGVVLIAPVYGNPTGTAELNTQDNNALPNVSLKLEGGSFGLLRENINLQQQSGKYALNITQAYQQSDGYRDHSAMDRKYFQILQKLDYASNASLKALIFYSDLHYNTPGGLTEAQYLENPKASRSAAGKFKSAKEQQAAIFSKTLYGGLSHDWALSNNFKHVIAVFSSFTNFKNPFISNYERRDEFTLGLRSYLQYTKASKAANWRFNLGLESMRTSTNYDNYDNNLGFTGAIQASDDLNATSNFAFAQISADIVEKLLLEISASANLYKYDYRRTAPVLAPQKTNKFDPQLMPRIALSYLLSKQLSLRGSVSKGYSPPTLSEVRASDNIVNVDLQPEYGWNYETGIRFQDVNNRLFLDVTGFYFHLKSAIVRRLNENNTEYFINSGGTKQWGLESSLAFWVLPARDIGFFRGIQLRNAYTLSHFRFEHYLNATEDYSGNALTGVPKTNVVSSVELQFPKRFYVFAQHNFTAEIPLNDANSVYAKQYHLLQAKAGLKGLRIGSIAMELFAGADNLLDQKYSLGNDINAAGGRYFNAAAGRNFYGGIAAKF